MSRVPQNQRSFSYVEYPQPTCSELIDAFGVLIKRASYNKLACQQAEAFLNERQFHCIIIHELLVCPLFIYSRKLSIATKSN